MSSKIRILLKTSSVSSIEIEIKEGNVLEKLVRPDREVVEWLEESGLVVLEFLKVLDLIITAKSMLLICFLSFWSMHLLGHISVSKRN